MSQRKYTLNADLLNNRPKGTVERYIGDLIYLLYNRLLYKRFLLYSKCTFSTYHILCNDIWCFHVNDRPPLSVSRLDEKDAEMKREYAKLHDRYTELFKTHIDSMERTKSAIGQERCVPQRIRVQGGWRGCPSTGNGEKLSNSQVCCLAQLCLAAA